MPNQMGTQCGQITVYTVTQSYPSPILSCVEKVPKNGHVSLLAVGDSDTKSCNQPGASNVLHDVHISAQLMEDFLELARENTKKNLETCGVLGAFLERGTYYVTTLIIPKQESTSNSVNPCGPFLCFFLLLLLFFFPHLMELNMSKVFPGLIKLMSYGWQCDAIKEEEFFAIQNEHSLFPVGWIHTHPSQSCFMSSIDLHTHYSYQVMLPEAFAIVMAPTDALRSYGIFRLSDPGGMHILKECQEAGFHSHGEPADGGPIYEHCSNVYTNSNLRFEIFDLR